MIHRFRRTPSSTWGRRVVSSLERCLRSRIIDTAAQYKQANPNPIKHPVSLRCFDRWRVQMKSYYLSLYAFQSLLYIFHSWSLTVMVEEAFSKYEHWWHAWTIGELFAYLSVFLFACLFVHLSVCLALCLFVRLSVCLSISICLPVCLSVCLSVCPPRLYLPVCMKNKLSVYVMLDTCFSLLLLDRFPCKVESFLQCPTTQRVAAFTYLVRFTLILQVSKYQSFKTEVSSVSPESFAVTKG